MIQCQNGHSHTKNIFRSSIPISPNVVTELCTYRLSTVDRLLAPADCTLMISSSFELLGPILLFIDIKQTIKMFKLRCSVRGRNCSQLTILTFIFQILCMKCHNNLLSMINKNWIKIYVPFTNKFRIHIFSYFNSKYL